MQSRIQCMAAGAPKSSKIITSADLQQAARRLNVELREQTLGPWYQIELYSGDRQLGKTSGWAQPWGVLHLETIEVRRFTGYWVSNKGTRPANDEDEKKESDEETKKRYADVAKIARWFGLLLSVAIGVWNREKSPVYCPEAHLLAIFDEEKQHKKLVRYYRSLGFKTMKEPEEISFQDQVVWGGKGTMMKVTDEEFMERWSPIVRELASPVPGAPM